MTPEDIEQLKQLKALKDDGVITEAEFETQKQLVLNPGFVESDLKSTSALEPESKKLHVPSEEPRPSVFVGLGGGVSSASVEKPRDNGPLKIFAAIFALAALVAIGVVVSNRGGNSEGTDVEKSTRTSVTPVVSETPDSAAPGTEAPVEEDLVDEGQLWVWYGLMVRCANQVVGGSAGSSMSRTDLVEVHQPAQSYMAGVSSRVANLVESTDWSKANTSDPSALTIVMSEMVSLLRENAFLSSIASRTAPEAWNDLSPRFRELDFVARFQTMDDLIYSLIGGGFPPEIAESVGEDGSWCDYLSRYEESPPDFSYFRPEKNFTDEFRDSDLRQVCGMIRDLDVPNGNNPDANISYLSAQAQRLYEKILNDELYSQPQSRFYYLGIDLVATMEVFVEGTEQYMPMSHMSVVEDCEGLGW